MGEGEEAVFSVVRAHATLTDTAEAHFTGGKVDDNVVDAATAVGKLGGDTLDMVFVA